MISCINPYARETRHKKTGVPHYAFFNGSRNEGIAGMRKQVLRVMANIALIILASACAQRTSTPADTVLKHARIYTVNANLPWAQALAVREGKIVAVGSDEAIAAYQGPSTKVMDARGRMALPGFMDSHVHMMAGAAQLEGVSLNEAKTIGEFQEID